jgi:hypothetical protein
MVWNKIQAKDVSANCLKFAGYIVEVAQNK